MFKHALVRDAAHESLLKSKQHAIHARILTALEGASDAPPEILAQHATEAGCIEKAIDYWQSAAVLAIARPAYQEAILRVKQALKLAESMPADRVWQERRLQLMLLLGQATIPLRGYSHSETLDVFMQAQELVAAIDDTPLRFSVAYAMWVVYYVRGEHIKAFEVAQDICERANREHSDRRMLSGLRSLGISQMILGDPVTAHITFTRAQDLAVLVHQQSREQRIAVAQRFGADPEIATQFHVALDALGARPHRSGVRSWSSERWWRHGRGVTFTRWATRLRMERSSPWLPATRATRCSSELRLSPSPTNTTWTFGGGTATNGYAHVLAGYPASASDYGKWVTALERAPRPGQWCQRTVPCTPTLSPMRDISSEPADEAALVREEVRAGNERYFWTNCLCWLGDYFRLADARSWRRSPRPAYAEALDHARQQRAISWKLVSLRGWRD